MVLGKNDSLTTMMRGRRLALFTLQNYHYAKSLEDAYTVLQESKHNVILGGLLWLKMNKKAYRTGIDLGNLGLDQITNHENHIEIGSRTTLRQMEKDPSLLDYCNGIIPKAISAIIGVQFRNTATLGGSIYSRFGFSDVITALLALDCQIELYNQGVIALASFLENPLIEKDIIIKLIIPKEQSGGAYFSQRLSATDLPILTVGMVKNARGWRIAVGARPHRARLAIEAAALLSLEPTEDEIKKAMEKVSMELTYGTNLRGTAQYRQALAQVFIKRGVRKICG